MRALNCVFSRGDVFVTVPHVSAPVVGQFSLLAPPSANLEGNEKHTCVCWSSRTSLLDCSREEERKDSESASKARGHEPSKPPGDNVKALPESSIMVELCQLVGITQVIPKVGTALPHIILHVKAATTAPGAMAGPGGPQRPSVALPAFQFAGDGIDSFFSILQDYCFLSVAPSDPQTLLVNDPDDALQRSRITLDLGPQRVPSVSSSSIGPVPRGAGRSVDQAPDFSWSLLDKFSKVTKAVGKTLSGAASGIAASGSASTGYPGYDRGYAGAGPLHGRPAGRDQQQDEERPWAPPVPQQYLRYYPHPAEVAAMQERRLQHSRSSRQLYAHKPVSTDLGAFELLSEGGEDSELASGRSGRDAIDLERSDPEDSLAALEAAAATAAASNSRARQEPVTLEEWRSFFANGDGSLDAAAEQRIRERIFYGGLADNNVRREAWMFLCHAFSFSQTAQQRQDTRHRLGQEYASLKRQWTSIGAEQASHFEEFRDRKHRIDKDVTRTDRAHPFYSGPDDHRHIVLLHDVLLSYSFFNFDIGYVQGMNDLLSPILFVMEGQEADSFWCFKGVMDSCAANFHKNQAGMTQQLSLLRELLRLLDPPLFEHLVTHDSENMFFAFRWFLTHFKRELDYDQTMRLWEVCWSNYLVIDRFHLFIAAAIMSMYRDQIPEGFDLILKFVNDLSGNLDLDRVLVYAEQLFNKFLFLYKQGHVERSLGDAILNKIE